MTCRYEFPNPKLVDPFGEGLIAFGADLEPDTLVCAYRQGLFPWFNAGEPIAWWSPDPRCIIYPDQFTPSKSLARRMKRGDWQFSVSLAFNAVIEACSDARAYADSTWINPEMIAAYKRLHQQGIAHSVEIWQDDQLVGGLYGLKLGQAFFGESMFHRVTDASKAAFFVLMQLCSASKFPWVDCQVPNEHLMRLGASTLPREVFLSQLAQQISQPTCDWSAVVAQKLELNGLLTQPGLALLVKPTNELL